LRLKPPSMLFLKNSPTSLGRMPAAAWATLYSMTQPILKPASTQK